jgi:hypothetical protein
MLKIDGAELRKALEDIKRAEKNGFMFCQAVFEPLAVDGVWVVLRYSDLMEKAHPTDGNFDWGRFQGVSRRNRFKAGKLFPIRGKR